MALDYLALWQALNNRQQTYLKFIFEIDQQNEESYQRNWSVSRRGFPPPASEWRWISYDGGADGWGDTELRRRLRKEGFVDQGTGATFEALANRGYIKRKWSEPDLLGHQILYVQMTRRGRKLIRENIPDSSQRAPRLKKGQLQSWQWDALARLYAAAPEALAETKGITRNSWERLENYTPPLMRIQNTNYKAGSYKSLPIITQAGVTFYETNYALYKAMYSDVKAQRPSGKILPEPSDPFDRFVLLMKQKRGKRGLKAVSQEIGVTPTTVSRMERGIINRQEDFAAVLRWLDVDIEDFQLDF